MKITINNKTLLDTLNAILLKGKYPDGAGTKTKSISDIAVMKAETNSSISILNANDTTACSLTIPSGDNLTISDIGFCFLDIPKISSYLKAFKGNVTISVSDNIHLSCENKTATISKIIEHPHFEMINMVAGIELPDDGQMPTFGKNKVAFESRVVVNSDILIDAFKTCEVSNTGVFKLDSNIESFIISSPSINNENIAVGLDTVSIEGEEATVEIAGAFNNILSGPVILYLKDDFPVLIITSNGKLIKAPRYNPR
tara:strand:- start:679 stop:1446 length:768 start_codon:yes stop_codon:yes gene_type:complete